MKRGPNRRSFLKGSALVGVSLAAEAIGLSPGALQNQAVPPTGRDSLPNDVSSTTTVWFRQPAEAWTEALPVGNGRIGAMVFGGINEERIQINEETVWAGGPYNPANPKGPAALAEVRRLVLADKPREAQHLFDEAMMGTPVGQMKYQPVGDLRLYFKGRGPAVEYQRLLDLDSAIVRVTFQQNGVTFTREVFASAVDQVIVVRLAADRTGHIAFEAVISGGKNERWPGDESSTSTGVAPDSLRLTGQTATYQGVQGRVRYEAGVRVLATGGRTEVSDAIVKVSGADAVTILIAVGTNFVRYDDVTGNPAARVTPALATAAAKGYEQLRAEAVADHQRLFRRTALELPESAASALPTDERMKKFAAGGDPALLALFFQFGRYLLIGSSRPGCKPPNLQGIWNGDMNPAWDCKFTTNINLQMNYWPVDVANLSDCFEPLEHMMRDVAESGARTARTTYGAPGWVLHQNTDLWMATAPMDGAYWGTFSTGGAWLCTQLWDHYVFTGDREYLARVYPIIKGSAEFFLHMLVEHPTKHWLVTCPSTSPENWYKRAPNPTKWTMQNVSICAGATIENQILRDLFDACSEASRLLNSDMELRARVDAARSRLAPIQIGRFGQVQEWLDDWDDPEDTHRHISPMYGLYPSHQITPRETPDLAKAAKQFLIFRSDGSGDRCQGWGQAWKAGCWARLLDGDHALRVLTLLVTENAYPNLWSRCGAPQQVDGNFGLTAAVVELVLQSHGGELALLPAVPSSWRRGRAKGLRARGGFEVDLEWTDSRLETAVVRSHLGRPCRLRTAEPVVIDAAGRAVAVKADPRDAGVVTFDSVRGGVYTIRRRSQPSGRPDNDGRAR